MKQTTLVGFGFVALVGALLATVGAIPSAGAALARDTAVIAIGGLLAAFGIGLLGAFVASEPTLETESENGDEPVAFPSVATQDRERDVERIGQDVEIALSRSRLGDSPRERHNRSVARNRLRRTMTDAVVSSLTADGTLEVEAARDHVQRGTWTDDPRAAACLSSAVTIPLATRIEDWVVGERDQRQLQAALEALTALRADDLQSSSQQSPDGRERRRNDI
ncbi:DUF7269 family protein [Natronosalvus vescus]|uniref:DUF7269 family protein n=1 Tax=Natronosalvus vescus TaxID=2953881 RepID=UPI0020910F2F|nr:hypothetical protein [Natronosalvus vescus]